MATTGIWPVKSNLLALIKYTENPAKTWVDNFKALHDVLNYDMNGDKTEQRLYVTGINCLPETAYADFEFYPLKKYSYTIWFYKHQKNNVPDFIDVIFAIIRMAYQQRAL